MIAKIVFRLALTACFANFAPAAMAQDAGKPDAPASMTLDAAPADGAAPDPLAPPEVNGPPPIAPGAPAPKPAETAQAPLPEPDPVATQILARLANAGGKQDARDDIAGMKAFYTENKGQAIWTGSEGFNPQAQKAIREIHNADSWGLESSAFQLPANPGAQASPETSADADIKLSLAVLKYARHARGGRTEPTSISPIIDRRPHIFDPKSVLEAIAAAESADAYLRGLHPKHEQFKRLRQALLNLNKSGSGTSFPRIPAGPDFRPGDDNPQIAMIRRRLSADASGSRETAYDETLLVAVNRYQKSHGLEVTGIIDRKLRASLNEGAGGSSDENKLRIIVNMERWRWMPESLGDFYVWDSITEQYTRVFDRGRVVLMEKIVVGKPNTPTPTFTANMQFIVFHPEWGVPDGIKTNEIAPKLRQSGGGDGFFFFGGGGGSSEILRRLGGLRVSINGHEVDPDSVDWSRVDIRRYQFIQGAGQRNVLGVVKFRFPNKHDVYMHDTPDRHLFGAAPRAFSHGCMRTQNPIHLAEVLLAHDKGYSAGQVREMVEAGATNEIKLSTQIPVHVAYFTAEVDEQGQLRYFPDIYGLDSRIASALKGQQIHFASDAAVSAENDAGEERTSRPRDRERPRPYAGRRPFNPFEDWN
jgi:L,D-transpeptidase YcbB